MLLIASKYSPLGISIVISIGTLIFLILSDQDWNIFKRKFSERLVVYLAVADILFRYVFIVFKKLYFVFLSLT